MKQSSIHEEVKKEQEHPSSQHDDQDDMLPCDSRSNLSSKKQGSTSNVSSTSSARLRAEAQTLHYISCHLADAFLQSDLQLLYMSEVAQLWSN